VLGIKLLLPRAPWGRRLLVEVEEDRLRSAVDDLCDLRVDREVRTDDDASEASEKRGCRLLVVEEDRLQPVGLKIEGLLIFSPSSFCLLLRRSRRLLDAERSLLSTASLCFGTRDRRDLGFGRVSSSPTFVPNWGVEPHNVLVALCRRQEVGAVSTIFLVDGLSLLSRREFSGETLIDNAG
jgi:hypothetical protein